MGNTIIISAISVVVLLTAVIIVYAVRKTSQYSSDILSRLKESVENPKSGKSSYAFNASVDNMDYTCTYVPKSRYGPPALEISMEYRSSIRFEIKTESKFDSFSKNIGISSEIETGYPEFDSRFYIDTYTTESMQLLLNDRCVRQAVEKIFNSGFVSIVHNGKTVTATLAPLSPDIPDDKNILSDTVRSLIVLVKGLSDFQGQTAETGTAGARILNTFIISVLSFLIITGLVILLIGIARYMPLDRGIMFLDSLKYSMPVFIVFLIFAVIVLRGRSSSHRMVVTVSVMSFAAFIISGYGLELFLNGYLDKSRQVLRSAPVSGKYYRNTRSGTIYYIKLKSWRPGRETESLGVRRSLYDAAKPGGSVISITTRSGNFGFEWVVEYELEG